MAEALSAGGGLAQARRRTWVRTNVHGGGTGGNGNREKNIMEFPCLAEAIRGGGGYTNVHEESATSKGRGVGNSVGKSWKKQFSYTKAPHLICFGVPGDAINTLFVRDDERGKE